MDDAMQPHPVITAPRRSGLRAAALVSLITVPVMTVGLPMAFLFAYGFQETTWGTHLAFLVLVGLITLVQCGLAGPGLAHSVGLTVPRSTAGTLLVTLAWLTATGAVYSLANVLPALDPSVTSGMSDPVCVAVAVGLGVATVLLARGGVRLLRPRSGATT